MTREPLLLVALRLQASADGLVEVTVAQLADTLGCSERQVQRLLRLLETSGAITAICKTGGRGIPAQYRLNSTLGGGVPLSLFSPFLGKRARERGNGGEVHRRPLSPTPGGEG